jgi:hypothetical protein
MLYFPRHFAGGLWPGFGREQEPTMNDVEAGIPNLDCMEFDDLLLAQAAFHKLELYTANKANAVAYRNLGNVHAALVAEQKCDRLYRELPAWARW